MGLIKEKIKSGKTFLGIELGSTRIKASLIDDSFSPVASGSFEWENRLENGYWTYSLDDVDKGIKACYKALSEEVSERYGVKIETFGAIGVSAMMHGYLAFDKEDNLLTPFRTWRNTTTEEAAKILSDAFDFNIPQRWSIAHLYQAILNKEEHIDKISYITTLSGYIQYMLTGKHEIGIGDASGMFPLCGTDYDKKMLDKFDDLVKGEKLPCKVREILPEVKVAGENDSYLTESGALFLDPTGTLKPGILVCPPEGDAGTGMVATNSVLPKTGNISAGTSVFSMLVLENPLKERHTDVDIVSTPSGESVAMVHCNNCSNELDSWVNIFCEFSELMGLETDKSMVYEKLYNLALSGNSDGIAVFNYLSGEHITDIKKGKPMYFRLPEKKMHLADFIKAQLNSAFATLSIGMDILFREENVRAELFTAHGGIFKTKGVAQKILADALDTPVSVMETSGEGGAWGMALLAAYAVLGRDKTLGEWLESEVFKNDKGTIINPDKEAVRDFNNYKKLFLSGLKAESALEEIKG
ncbi:MAG: ATPase [Clostridia bacterium]|nr:ATPase [Clostridia bacterium]